MDTKIWAAAGTLGHSLDLLPLFAASHATYKIREGNSFDSKRELGEVLTSLGMVVHGKPLRIVFEQSSERKRDYGVYAAARKWLFSDSQVARSTTAESERSLELCRCGICFFCGQPSSAG